MTNMSDFVVSLEQKNKLEDYPHAVDFNRVA